MSSYKPLYITAFEEGLVQQRQNFLLPNDAFPTLANAYVWRERIKRKQGCTTLGRLRRVLGPLNLGNSVATNWNFNIWTALVPAIVPEANATISPGSVIITIQAGPDIILTDTGLGTLTSLTAGTSGTINYITGDIVSVNLTGIFPTIISFNYFPGLPVMGLRLEELNSINVERTVAFDTKYAYRFVTGWEEFIPNTVTWTGTNSKFFWTTNYWVDAANQKLFWVTNFSGTAGDPIRYTNGPTGSWTNFAPGISGPGVGTSFLTQCLAILPFRGRLVVFNTLEGVLLTNSVAFPNRIRWSAIGSPLLTDAWKDDVRGKGGFLDIPTSQDIVSVGFVRDNLVIYCESSTWQLRYTGQSVSPFQIEKVNSELGAESTFSTVQFDTSLVGVGDKGIVECDSFSSKRIDIKIPDLIFNFNNLNEGTSRVQGVRDFVRRLAFWTYPYVPESGGSTIYPNRRLVYNYENASWAIFTDSFTALGTFQPLTSQTWAQTTQSWASTNVSWISNPALIPKIVGGNQQGYVMLLDQKVTNDNTLFIKAITSDNSNPTVITSPDHNLEDGMIVRISKIVGSGYSSLNGSVFLIAQGDIASPPADKANKFRLFKFNSTTGQFDLPQLDASTTYIGAGEISIVDNFSVVSKKFNFVEQGQSIQIGYIDLLTDSTPVEAQGAFTLNMYVDYSDSDPINQLPQNIVPFTGQPDQFFNTTVSTTQAGGQTSDKNFQRVYCACRGAFLTIEWTFSPAQMNGVEQGNNVQIDSQVVWMRPAGSSLNIGI